MNTKNRSNLDWLAKIADLTGKLRQRGKWLGRLIMVGTVMYAAVLLIFGWQQIRSVDWIAYLPAWLLSIGLYLLSVLLQMWVWFRILRSYQPKIGWQDVRIYMHTVLLRQLPGGVWHWAGRATLYQAAVPAKTIMLANVLEWLVMLLTACVAYGVWTVDAAIFLRLSLIVGATAVIIFFVRLWRPQPRALVLDAAEGLLWTVLYTLSWSLGGAILYALAAVNEAITFAQFSDMASIWALAGGVSALTIIAPSGLGIREASLVLLLGGYISAPLAALIAIMLRLLFILSDVIWGGLGWWLTLKKRPQAREISSQ